MFVSAFQDRKSGGLTEHKLPYAHKAEHISNLEDVVKTVKPSAIIGEFVLVECWASYWQSGRINIFRLSYC